MVKPTSRDRGRASAWPIPRLFATSVVHEKRLASQNACRRSSDTGIPHKRQNLAPPSSSIPHVLHFMPHPFLVNPLRRDNVMRTIRGIRKPL